MINPSGDPAHKNPSRIITVLVIPAKAGIHTLQKECPEKLSFQDAFARFKTVYAVNIRPCSFISAFTAAPQICIIVTFIQKEAFDPMKRLLNKL
jgi:hypothetical protein